MNPPTRNYTAYGLRIRSEIALPLTPASSAGEPDLDIRIGAVPGALAASRFQRRIWEAAPGRFLLDVEGVARYFAREGREVVVEPTGDDAGARNAFLLGSVFAACLKQRGILTLHASAIATDAGAVLFAGHSGIGKSTLLAALVERGYPMLADDVTGIVADGGGAPLALPAFPCVRLWADAVETLGWQGKARQRVREGMEKYQAPVACFREAPLPVRAVVVLARHNRDGIEIQTVSPGTEFEWLGRLIYRRQQARGLGLARKDFETLATVVRRVPLIRVLRPMRGSRVAALADRIEDCLRDAWPSRAGQGKRHVSGGRAARTDIAPAPAGEGPARSIVWLASYPRSGNTWLRALLTNYLDGGESPASIDALLTGPSPVERGVFDEEFGLSSSDLTPEEAMRHRPSVHELLAAKLPRPSFVKVHEACLRTAGGGLLFPPAATLGAVYIVRNPLDVAVSLAHFWNSSIARAVGHLNREVVLAATARGIREVLPQPLSTWSGHARSWVDQRDLPVHTVRYEDLLADPDATFAGVLRFAGIEPEARRVARAVGHACFDRLRAQEERSGFVEKPQTARYFFRAGRAGAWREALPPEQVRTLVDAHAPLMERFGYLSEAEAFLAGQDAAP